MLLAEIYTKGKGILLDKEIGFTLGGVETGWVMKNNRTIMERYAFRQKAIGAPSEAKTDMSVLGVNLKTPVIMSAMTMPIPAIRENGLMLVAQGIKAVGSMMWTGTPLPQNLGELAETGVPIIQNVKPLKDRKKLFEDLDAIQDAGVTWVGIEIDAGVGTKIEDKTMAYNCSPLSMTELSAIRKKVKKPLIFKGILGGFDALKSLEAGADAIMVSNHGAHTIDYLPHPFQVMEEIRSVAKEKVPIMVDGGFRRGTDVLKALALGADLVGLGRPILYGLAADGAEGVRDVIRQITEELSRTMVMLGAETIDTISPECLVRLPSLG